MRTTLLVSVVFALLLTNCSEKLSEEKYCGSVSDENVNFRTGPGLEYRKIGYLPRTTELEIIGRSMEKMTIAGESAYWYEIQSDGQIGWVWGKYFIPKNSDSAVDGILLLFNESESFSMRFKTRSHKYSLSIRKMDIATSINYWLVDSNPWWPPKTALKTFIDSGVCVFNKKGELVDFIRVEDTFNFPSNSISPNQELFSISLGDSAIGRGLAIYRFKTKERILTQAQAAGEIFWIDDSHIVFSSFDRNSSLRNWPSEDSYYLGVSLLSLDDMKTTTIIPPTDSSNFMPRKLVGGKLFYTEVSFRRSDQGFSRAEVSHELDLTEFHNK